MDNLDAAQENLAELSGMELIDEVLLKEIAGGVVVPPCGACP